MTTGRPPNILRPTALNTNLPEDLRAKLDIYLFSEVEGRIPHGAYSKFIVQRIREFFDPLSPQMKLDAFKKRIEQTEINGWSPEQIEAIEAFRDHILDR